jgi:ring-1,2-phenylacetyl-CoA epoxidase subunit PaaE
MTPRFHSLRIAEVRRETPDCISVAFEVPAALAEEFRYAPGQHLSLRAVLDGEELRRSYSICSGLDDGELRVAIKKVGGGRFSSWANEALRPGQRIDVMTPDGRFTVPIDPAHAKHYIAFAAGSGITPILSLAKTLLAREPQSRFTLVYGNRRAAGTMFVEELAALKNRHLTRFMLLPVFSREDQEVDLFNGRIDATKVRRILAELVSPQHIDEAFVCGPASMLDEVEQELARSGVPSARVHVERFGTPGAATGVAAAPDAADARLTILIDGVRREVEFHRHHGSVLEAGRAAGLDLPYSCKGGMCCTCRAKLLDGEVKMHRNFALEKADLEAGFVLTCQSYPRTERVLLSFDER